MEDERFINIDLMPTSLNRNKSQQSLSPSEARILQSVDVLWMEYRARRGAGYARTNLPTETATIPNAIVITRQDCNQAVLYHTGTNNSIKAVWGDGTFACRGPVPFWQDTTTGGGSGQAISEDGNDPQTSDY